MDPLIIITCNVHNSLVASLKRKGYKILLSEKITYDELQVEIKSGLVRRSNVKVRDRENYIQYGRYELKKTKKYYFNANGEICDLCHKFDPETSKPYETRQHG